MKKVALFIWYDGIPVVVLAVFIAYLMVKTAEALG